jgi:hypothetical protein
VRTTVSYWQAICGQAKPGGAQVPQLALQHTCPLGQVTLPQVAGALGTQAQTWGDESKCVPWMQSTVSMQLQIPMQSAPPLAGSQLSVGSSTHLPPPGQGVPARPPQVWAGAHAPWCATDVPPRAATQPFA